MNNITSGEGFQPNDPKSRDLWWFRPTKKRFKYVFEGIEA